MEAKKMKFRWLILSMLVLSIALTACGGGDGDGDDPSKPVKDFFDAFADMDAGKAADAVCKQYSADFEEGLEMIFSLFTMAGDDVKIEISGLKMKVEDKKDNEAYVVATGGTMKISVGGEVMDESELGDDTERLKVIKEDGKWVICDDAFAAEMGGGF
jgi:hypothetical protein